ncbi:MAG: helix-turn-helix domain-containing protein [Candidatus Kerfeldbacteria bacterium]|nr:helix-turn-helix domain-containing protein [Candidatus Kerfeldbacteria bacterium]
MTETVITHGHPRTDPLAADPLLTQEELILDVTEAVCRAMEQRGISKFELARLAGRTDRYVDDFLTGRRVTLRGLSDLALALGFKPKLVLEPMFGQTA